MFHTGCKLGTFRDPIQGADIPVAILYPTRSQPSLKNFGQYDLHVAMNAPVSGAGHPLVVISHGGNGSPWTLRGLGSALAQAGFIVAMPEHIGNSRSDSSLEGTAANLKNRPRHIRQTIEYVRADQQFHMNPPTGPVGLIGISIGGYTALAAAGGRPWANERELNSSLPEQIHVEACDRVGAIVLLAPATFWFVPDGSLKEVQCPILLYSGGKDDVTPLWCADVVKTGVARAENVTHRIIPGAGHFSFLSAFPAPMRRADFPPSQDPEGFDRHAFQDVLHDEIISYLTAKLAI